MGYGQSCSSATKPRYINELPRASRRTRMRPKIRSGRPQCVAHFGNLQFANCRRARSTIRVRSQLRADRSCKTKRRERGRTQEYFCLRFLRAEGSVLNRGGNATATRLSHRRLPSLRESIDRIQTQLIIDALSRHFANNFCRFHAVHQQISGSQQTWTQLDNCRTESALCEQFPRARQSRRANIVLLSVISMLIGEKAFIFEKTQEMREKGDISALHREYPD